MKLSAQASDDQPGSEGTGAAQVDRERSREAHLSLDLDTLEKTAREAGDETTLSLLSQLRAAEAERDALRARGNDLMRERQQILHDAGADELGLIRRAEAAEASLRAAREVLTEIEALAPATQEVCSASIMGDLARAFLERTQP